MFSGVELSDEQIGISYTDGSFSKNQTSAAYACCKLLNESPDGLLDDFTGKKFIFDAFSGTIKEGTNNIGELTAIKIAIENFNDKTFQLIISDSIYGIKSYREYIHVWKNNGIMGGLLSVGIKRKGAVQYRQQQHMPLQNQESGGEVFIFC